MTPLALSEGLQGRVWNPCLAGQGRKSDAVSRVANRFYRGVDVVHVEHYYGVPYFWQETLRKVVVSSDDGPSHQVGMSETLDARREAFRDFVNRNGKVAGVARVARVPATTLYSYLKGETDSLKGSTEQKLATAFDVRVAQMFGGEAEPKTVPVVGLVGAGSVATLFSAGQGPFDQVEPPHDATDSTVALGIRGASLGPAFDEGIVFYDDVRSPVTPDLHGRLCVVGLPDGRVLVKLLRSAGDGSYHLFSNTLEDPLLNQAVDWAARVKDVRPR